jgi:hypothetical protein
MTVADLIVKLQTFDSNKEVQVFDHIARQFTAPVVQLHTKRSDVVWLIGQPWSRP